MGALPVSANSYTGVCEMVYSHPSIRFHKHRYMSSRHRYTSSQTPVYEFADTGIRVCRHRYTSSQTPGDEFPHKMYGQYRISQTPVYEFTDTGIRVRRHRYTSSKHRYTSSKHRYTNSQTPEAQVHLQFWVTYRSKLKNLKTWGSLK